MVAKRTRIIGLEDWNCQSTPTTSGKGRAVAECWSSMANDLINCIYVTEASIKKNPQGLGSEIFQVGAHVEVLREWHSQGTQGHAMPLSPYPALCISFYLAFGVRIELNCNTLHWCQTITWWRGKNPHLPINVNITYTQ